MTLVLNLKLKQLQNVFHYEINFTGGVILFLCK